MSSDYQRYKQKLERLQCKVKRSENARKELELRFQRLMRERNECEKTASIQKSKYHTLLENERKRLSRNDELLQMLQDIQVKAETMASNTEKLKKLKNQQERVLINNWRRNVYLQQHMFYPNVVLSSGAKYLPSPYGIGEQTRFNSIPNADNSNQLAPIHYEKPLQFAEAVGPIPQKPIEDLSPLTKSAFKNVLQQQPAMAQVQGPSLISPYDGVDVARFREPFNAQINNLPLRLHENQYANKQVITPTVKMATSSQATFGNHQTILARELPSNILPRIEHSTYYPHRINNTMANLSPLDDRSTYNRYSNSIATHENAPSGFASLEKFKFDEPFVKAVDESQSQSQLQSNKNPSYLYKSQLCSPIERTNLSHMPMSLYTKESASQKINIPSSIVSDFNSQQINESMTNFIPHDQRMSQSIEPSSFSIGVRTTQADSIRDRTDRALNHTDTDRMQEYEKSANNKNNEPFKDDPDNDVYGLDNKSQRTHESTDLRQFSNTTTKFDADTVPSETQSPQKNVSHFVFDEDIKQTHQPVTVSTVDDTPNKSRYSYENDPVPIYTSTYKYDSTALTQANNQKFDSPTESTSFHFDKPDRDTKASDKRRSSIDASSFAKTLGYDNDLEKESITANLRRRYSVAANFLNLPNTAPNLDSFKFTSSPATEYLDTSNVKNEANRDKFVNDNSVSISDINDDIENVCYKDDERNVNKIDLNVMARMSDSMKGTSLSDFNDSPMPVSTTTVSQPSTEVTGDTHYRQIDNESNEPTDFNAYDNNTPYLPYTLDEQNYVENAMEQLNLGNDDQREPIDDAQAKQFDDGMDKIRTSGTHSKTVTWADDPNSNYKKGDILPTYDPNDTTNAAPVDTFYAESSESQQIQHEYVPEGDNQVNLDTSNSTYQYESNQYETSPYDSNQYQATNSAANQNIYSNDDYYYGTEQMNQYDQYGTQPQENSQQMQYYDGSENHNNNNDNNTNYQQYQTETTLQAQPKQDEYYSVSPGENYYNDYENIDKNQDYTENTNIGSTQEVPPPNIALHPNQSHGTEQHPEQRTEQPSHQAQQEYDYSANIEPANVRVPNYLQSDTDDSETGYQNIANKKQPQHQDSDFDFSTNS